MKLKLSMATVLAAALPWLSGCSDVAGLSSTGQIDTTDPASFPGAEPHNAPLLSAFYGLDDAIPFLASFRICGEFGHKDGMPAIFPTEVDLETLQAGDFLVTLADGQTVSVACATPAPAADVGELRTILLIGDFGSIDNQPVSVEIIGNLLSMERQTNYRGSQVDVTPLEAGPSLVRAEVVPEDQWELGKAATTLPFGGGSGCPEGTRQVVRAVWAGGVTKPGGDEVDDLERQAYRVVVGEDGNLTETIPFALGDLGDGDNNHELCLDVAERAVSVEFPAGLMTDPRDDANPATGISVSP